jgi:hypothetical protein
LLAVFGEVGDGFQIDPLIAALASTASAKVAARLR